MPHEVSPGRLIAGVAAAELRPDQISFAEVVAAVRSEVPPAMIVSTTEAGAVTQWSVSGVTAGNLIELRHPYGPGFAAHDMRLDEARYGGVVSGVVVVPHAGGGAR